MSGRFAIFPQTQAVVPLSLYASGVKAEVAPLGMSEMDVALGFVVDNRSLKSACRPSGAYGNNRTPPGVAIATAAVLTAGGARGGTIW